MVEILTRLIGEFSRKECWSRPDELAELVFVLGRLRTMRRLEMSEVVRGVLVTIASEVAARPERLTPHGISTALVGFVHLCPLAQNVETLMSVAAAEVVEKIALFEHRDLSQTAWAFAKCSLWNDLLWDALVVESRNKMRTFSPLSLSQLSWAMAQWSRKDQALTDALVDKVLEDVDVLPPRPISTIALALASLKVANTTVFDAISESVTRRADGFGAQDISDMVWAYVKLGGHDQRVFEAMALQLHASMRRVRLDPGELCEVVSAFSQLKGETYRPLLAAIATEAHLQFQKLQPEQVAVLMWSFAVVQVHHQPLLSAVGNAVAKDIESFEPQHLAAVARAYAAMLQRHTKFVTALAQHTRRCVAREQWREGEPAPVVFKPSHLSNIAFALASLAAPCEDALITMAPAIARGAAELRPAFLARCAHAYSLLSVRCPQLMTSIMRESVRKLPEFAARDLQRVVDSLYASLALQRGKKLEQELFSRMAGLAQGLRDTLPSPAVGPSTLPGAEYRSLMRNNKDFECGMAGVGPLLASLDIGLPGRDFMRRCFAQVRQKLAETSAAPRSNGGCQEFAMAEVDLHSSRQEGHEPHHSWFFRSEASSRATSISGSLLLPVEVAWRTHHDTRSTSLFLVLSDVCHQIAAMGVDVGCAESRAAVRGTVDVMCTLLPDVSSIGALRQFDTLFPNVTMTFAERVVRTRQLEKTAISAHR